jgi:hypothetical protein
MVGLAGDEVGRIVGTVEITSLVRNNCCVTALKPASSDEATSLGRAASNTERAFCEASAWPEADMVGIGPSDIRGMSLDDVATCSKAKRMFLGSAVDWVNVEVVAGRNRSVPVGSWEDKTLACRESRPLDPPETGAKGWAPNKEHDCGSIRKHGRLLAKVIASLERAMYKADSCTMREGSSVLTVSEYLSVSGTCVACDAITDVRLEFHVVAKEEMIVVFQLFTCDSSVPVLCCILDGYVQCIAHALTNMLKWGPNRNIHPIICSMLGVTKAGTCLRRA